MAYVLTALGITGLITSAFMFIAATQQDAIDLCMKNNHSYDVCVTTLN